MLANRTTHVSPVDRCIIEAYKQRNFEGTQRGHGGPRSYGLPTVQQAPREQQLWGKTQASLVSQMEPQIENGSSKSNIHTSSISEPPWTPQATYLQRMTPQTP